MNGRACKAISTAVFDSDLVATRILLGISEALWAIMLWWPGDTFGRPTYSIMARVFEEDVWALIFAVTSFFQIYIVVAAKYRGVFARNFALWNAFLWVFVVGSMLLSVYPPPAAISGEASMMIAAVWVWARPVILAHWVRLSYGRAIQQH